MYTELHARSAFSFLEGATMPELLMQQAARLEMPAMGLLLSFIAAGFTTSFAPMTSATSVVANSSLMSAS